MPAPSFGNVDQSSGVAAPAGQTAAGLALYAQKHPDQWRLNNGNWENNKGGVWTPMYKNDAQQTPVGANANSFGNYVEGVTSGRLNIMGNENNPAKPTDTAKDDITARMNAFITAMGIPPDMSNPVYAGLVNAGTSAAGRMQGQAGVAGRSGMAGTQAASVVQANLLPYMQSREQAGAQMLQSLNGRDISLGQLAQGQQNINNGLAESQSNAAKNTASSLGSIGGGILGGVIGGPGGAAAGSQIGSGFLGSLAGGGGSGPNYSGSAWKPGRTGGSGY